MPLDEEVGGIFVLGIIVLESAKVDGIAQECADSSEPEFKLATLSRLVRDEVQVGPIGPVFCPIQSTKACALYHLGLGRGSEGRW